MIQKSRTGEELLRLWRRSVGLARSRTHDRSLAEEIASEAVFRLIARPTEEIHDDWKFVSHRVIELTAGDRRRTRRMMRMPNELIDELDAPASISPALPDEDWFDELVRLVREEAEQLPGPERRVVLAHLFEETTYLGDHNERHRRLAAALGSTVARTRHQLSRGLIRLRERIDRRLRRSGADEKAVLFRIALPLVPGVLAPDSLMPSWPGRLAAPSSGPFALAGVAALLGVGVVAVAGIDREPVKVSIVEMQSHSATLETDASNATVDPSQIASAPNLSPTTEEPAEKLAKTRHPRLPGALGSFSEDFEGDPVVVIAPTCMDGSVLPLGDSNWRVQNLRIASCLPSDNVNVVSIEPGGLRIHADENDAFGGYVGVDYPLTYRPLEWRMTVQITVHHVEDPLHRPVPQCSTQLGAYPAFGDAQENVGWCAAPGQILALRATGEDVLTNYVLEPGIEHTVELESTRAGSVIRAWPTVQGRRPREAMAVAASLGSLRRVLFSGPNWKRFDYQVRRLDVRVLGGLAYGAGGTNSTGESAALKAFYGMDPAGDRLSLDVQVRSLPPSAPSVLLIGTHVRTEPMGQGTLLVGGKLHAIAPVFADSAGRVQLSLSDFQIEALRERASEVYFQLLYRDPGDGNLRNATDAVRIELGRRGF